MRASSPGWSRRSPTARPRRAPTSSTSGSPRPTCSTSPPAASDLPGAMFTASHNPAQYNGIKLCRAGARPIGQDTGLAEIRDLAEHGAAATSPPTVAPGTSTAAATCSPTTRRYLRSPRRPRRHPAAEVVVDAGNGMGGHTVPAVLRPACRVDVVPLYFELDGTSPTTRPTRSSPRTCVDLQAARARARRRPRAGLRRRRRPLLRRRRARRAGLAGAITALVAVRELAKHPGSHGDPQPDHLAGGARDRRASTAARPVRTRVGHSFIKAEMAATDAVFGGEHSAHYYFRDFWRADTGMLAAMHVLAALGEQDRPAVRAGSAVPALRRLRRDQHDRRRPGGAPPTRGRARRSPTRAGRHRRRPRRPDRRTDRTGGSTCAPSNTEPLLRLNVEARRRAPTMEQRARRGARPGPTTP